MIVSFKWRMNGRPEIREGITFMPGHFAVQGFSEEDKVIFLLPDQLNVTDGDALLDPAWYDTDAKKNIVFFYPGSVAMKPVGTLYDAVVNESYGGRVHEIDFYEAESF